MLQGEALPVATVPEVTFDYDRLKIRHSILNTRNCEVKAEGKVLKTNYTV